MRKEKKIADINKLIKNIECDVCDDQIIVSIENAALGTIIAIKIFLKGYNFFDDIIKIDDSDVFSVVFQDLKIYPNTNMLNLKKTIKSKEIKKISIENVQLVFEDGDKYDFEATNEIEYEIYVLDENSDDYDNNVTEKEQLDALKEIDKKFICYPSKHELGWICACGMINKATNARCFFCGFLEKNLEKCSKDKIIKECLTKREDKEKREALLEKYKIENERNLKEKLENEKKEREKAAEESKVRMEREKKEEKKKKIFIFSVIIGVILSISIFSLIKEKIEKDKKEEKKMEVQERLKDEFPDLAGEYVYEYDIDEYMKYTIDEDGKVTTDAYISSSGIVSGEFVGINSDGSYVLELDRNNNSSLINYVYICELDNGEIFLKINYSGGKTEADADEYYLSGSDEIDKQHKKILSDNKKENEEDKKEAKDTYVEETRNNALKLSYSSSRNNGYTKVVVTIKNEGKNTYKFEKLRIAWYEGDEVIDTDWTYGIGAEGLMPEESTKATFSIKNTSVDSYKVTWMD